MIARGSEPLVFAPLAAMVGVAAYGLLAEDARATLWSVPLFLAFLALLAFFRDPARTPGRGVVSPADGRVLAADEAAGRLAVFMGLHNVHVNRAPLGGRIASIAHTRGGHAPAYSEGAARNERLAIVLDTPHGPMTVTQVAGVVARRIVPYVREGDRVKKGQRIGMVRFGSRVELTLPRGARLLVGAGARVRAGETTVAEVDGGVDP